MKSHHLFTLLLVAALQPLAAQNVTQDPEPDPVLEAIREFNEQRGGKPNEVTVVLDPVGEPPVPVDDGISEGLEVDVPSATEDPESDISGVVAEDAVLVTGKPPEDAQLLTNSESPEDDNAWGLTVRIEKLKSVPGRIDPAKVKLLAPFPAKPLSQPGSGWLLDAPDDIPPFTREVELAPGSKITLTIRPHVLIPESNGSNVFSVVEPGFNDSLGYQQTDTVGAILADSVKGLEDDSKRMGLAIERLQQLLVSLPKPEVEEESATPKKP